MAGRTATPIRLDPGDYSPDVYDTPPSYNTPDSTESGGSMCNHGEYCTPPESPAKQDYMGFHVNVGALSLETSAPGPLSLERSDCKDSMPRRRGHGPSTAPSHASKRSASSKLPSSPRKQLARAICAQRACTAQRQRRWMDSGNDSCKSRRSATSIPGKVCIHAHATSVTNPEKETATSEHVTQYADYDGTGDKKHEAKAMATSSPYPGLILQPDSLPSSVDQSAAEVKSIYASLVMVEAKCINIDAAQAADPSSAELGPEQWQALIALHRTLLHEHHDFLMAIQHPSATPALRGLATKYSMPARMWKHGIHAFLEVLRHRRPDSQDYMLSFIYLAYQMMALLFETVPAFLDTWIECLGDLARYRMAIEEEKESNAQWGGVAASWYTKAADRHPQIGRLYHHLGILERPSLRKFACYGKSLTSCIVPVPNARDSMVSLCNPIVRENESGLKKCHASMLTLEDRYAIANATILLKRPLRRDTAYSCEQGQNDTDVLLASLLGGHSQTQTRKRNELLSDAIPWQDICAPLNGINSQCARPDSLAKPAEATCEGAEYTETPLSEDYPIRGLFWTSFYFPSDWFNEEPDVDKQDNKPRMSSELRAKVMLPLDLRAAFQPEYIAFCLTPDAEDEAQSRHNGSATLGTESLVSFFDSFFALPTSLRSGCSHMVTGMCNGVLRVVPSRGILTLYLSSCIPGSVAQRTGHPSSTAVIGREVPGAAISPLACLMVPTGFWTLRQITRTFDTPAQQQITALVIAGGSAFACGALQQVDGAVDSNLAAAWMAADMNLIWTCVPDLRCKGLFVFLTLFLESIAAFALLAVLPNVSVADDDLYGQMALEFAQRAGYLALTAWTYGVYAILYAFQRWLQGRDNQPLDGHKSSGFRSVV